jgi:GcrA cell cycle regulator
LADVVRIAPNSSGGRALYARQAGRRGRSGRNLREGIADGPSAAGRAWPPERDAALVELWADCSLSAAEIGRRLGVSKNSVVGRSHRLHLKARPSPIIRSGDSPKPRQPRPARSTLRLEEIVPIREPASQMPQPPEPTIVGDRLRGPCCWPIGHPGTANFAYCGQQTWPGRPYCKEHCQCAYVGRARVYAHDGVLHDGVL